MLRIIEDSDEKKKYSSRFSDDLYLAIIEVGYTYHIGANKQVSVVKFPLVWSKAGIEQFVWELNSKNGFKDVNYIVNPLARIYGIDVFFIGINQDVSGQVLRVELYRVKNGNEVLVIDEDNGLVHLVSNEIGNNAMEYNKRAVVDFYFIEGILGQTQSTYSTPLSVGVLGNTDSERYAAVRDFAYSLPKLVETTTAIAPLPEPKQFNGWYEHITYSTIIPENAFLSMGYIRPMLKVDKFFYYVFASVPLEKEKE